MAFEVTFKMRDLLCILPKGTPKKQTEPKASGRSIFVCICFYTESLFVLMCSLGLGREQLDDRKGPESWNRFIMSALVHLGEGGQAGTI